MVLEELDEPSGAKKGGVDLEELPALDLEGIPEIETEIAEEAPAGGKPAKSAAQDEPGDETIDLETLDIGEEPTVIEAEPAQLEEIDGLAEDVDLEALAAEAEELAGNVQGGHAAGEADQLMLFLAAEEADLAHHFPLGQIADRAGIENQEIGLALVGDGNQPFFDEHARHDLRVQLIHLAAVGADKKCFDGFHRQLSLMGEEAGNQEIWFGKKRSTLYDSAFIGKKI